MKRIFIAGYYGHGNIGDDILLDIVYRDVKNILPKSKIGIMAQDNNLLPDIDLKIYKYNRKYDNKILFIISLLQYMVNIYKNNDIIIFGGGTQLFDNSKNSWKGIFVTAFVLIYNKLLLKRKIIHYGVGIGEINTSIGKFLTKIIGKMSYKFIVRDEASYYKLINLNIDKNKVILSADLAYSIKNINKEVEFDKKPIKIGFSLFEFYKYTNLDPLKHIELTKNVLEMIKYLLKNSKYDIYLFSFQIRYGNNDETYLKSLKESLNSPRVHFVSYSKNWMSTVQEINKMDVCVGMRYHFVILALKLGKPIIALNYASKVKEEMKMFNLERYLVELDNISGLHIMDNIQSILTDKEIDLLIETRLQKNYKVLDHSFDSLKSLISE